MRPVRRRDTRLVGRSGASQLILSNPELEELIVEVLRAMDSPADVRTLRQLVLSKIPLQDYNIASLDEELSAGNTGSTIRREAVDTRATPEAVLLRGEQEEQVSQMAGEFIDSIAACGEQQRAALYAIAHNAMALLLQPAGAVAAGNCALAWGFGFARQRQPPLDRARVEEAEADARRRRGFF